jgi:hypothetical protein
MGILGAGSNNTVSESDVFLTTTPEVTETHHPIPHGTLVETVKDVVRGAQWNIMDTDYALFHENNEMFAVWRIQNGKSHPDYDLTIGLRNSHNKLFAAGMAVGSYVMVCSNLDFSGEVTFGRKHTKNIMRDLRGLVEVSFSKVQAMRTLQDRRIEVYKTCTPSDTEVHDFLVRSVDQNIMANSYIPKVLKEYRTPRHEEFFNDSFDRTGWTLLNAYTEVFKGVHALTLPNRTIKLHSMLDVLCNGSEMSLEDVSTPEPDALAGDFTFTERLRDWQRNLN